jgi:hypothetical protein
MNSADILLPVNGIPKLAIAIEDAVAAPWPSPLLIPLKPGIRIIIIAFESVIIAHFLKHWL